MLRSAKDGADRLQTIIVSLLSSPQATLTLRFRIDLMIIMRVLEVSKMYYVLAILLQ